MWKDCDNGNHNPKRQQTNFDQNSAREPFGSGELKTVPGIC